MRSTAIILLGFVILIGSSLLINHWINYTSVNILIELEHVEELLDSKKFEEAQVKIGNTYKYWLEIKNWYAIVLNHNTLKSIEISYLRLQQYINYQDTSLAHAELKTLQLLLKDIPESESFKIYNIL
ncbi:MAG: DUF4363 family protein [Peptococcaceae bacterium]|nr:DUF4363 family protein [Peptococcaceae bacterium]